MKKLILIAVVTATSCTAMAQVSIEEAAARLEARGQQRVSAATRPSRLTNEEVETLLAENAKLREENAALKKQLAEILAKAGEREAANAAKPSTKGGLSEKNEYTVKTLLSQRLLTDKDKTQIELVRAKLAKQDAAIREYLDAYRATDRVKEGALRGEPAPGMPEELLSLIGRYEIKAETESSKQVEFVRYGYSWETWHLVIVDGKVSSQREEKGRFGEYSTCLPK